MFLSARIFPQIICKEVPEFVFFFRKNNNTSYGIIRAKRDNVKEREILRGDPWTSPYISDFYFKLLLVEIYILDLYTFVGF
jgi:hypothetical protein